MSANTIKLESSWKTVLSEEFNKEYFKTLSTFVRDAYISRTIYPHPRDVFNAFALCPFESVSVVILGQDPYHGPKQAHGLCFSVQHGIQIPPSLKNIYKEIQSDIGTVIHDTGDLTEWAKQGVLLLNATLTVEAARAGSHQGKGWEKFTDAAISTLSEKRDGLVFLLWGNYAQKKTPLIDSNKHLILTSPHPSPLSAHQGFFGNRHFSQTNNFLVQNKKRPIVW